MAQTPQSRNEEVMRLNQEGRQLRKEGLYLEALEKYQQALAIVQETKERQSEGGILNSIGLVYRSLGQYSKALEFYQQALAIRKGVGDRPGTGVTLNNIGEVYSKLGQPSKALEFYQQALLIRQEVGDRSGESATLHNIGAAYFRLEQYPKALEFYQKALSITQELGDFPGTGATLNNIGLVYDKMEQYSQALRLYQRALVIRRAVGDRASEGTTLSNIGLVYHHLKQYSKALEFYQQALAIRQETGDLLSEGITLHNMGEAYLLSGNAAAAEKPFYEAIAIWESLRPGLSDQNKVSLFETLPFTYGGLQKSLIQQNKSEAALEIAERGRARAFVELLAQRLQASPLASLPTGGKPPTIQQIKQIAKNHNATLVEYSILWDEILYIWVIQPSGTVAFRQVSLQARQPSQPATPTATQPTRSPFIQPITDLRTAIRAIGVVGKVPETPPRLSFTPDPDLLNGQLRQLHQSLIAPISDLLPTNPNQHIIFIPQGELFLVPFPALLDANGKSLVEKHTILTAPSIQVLELTQKIRREQSRIRRNPTGSSLLTFTPNSSLIVGNPTMPMLLLEPGKPAEQLASLPGAKKEAEAIAQFLQTSFLTGNQATKAVVKQQMPRAQLIHLATHGLLDERNGLNSAIALAPAGQDNGWLTADEILNLSLQAELVVLSACDSGRGKLTGDGVIGLSRSLISAGVPSVIVSLWSVPDAPTAELMTEFYQQLQKQPDKAQALRQAMLATKAKYPNPIAWAAFTLIGEAK